MTVRLSDRDERPGISARFSAEQIDRLIDWAHVVFIESDYWSLDDDRLLDRLYKYQRAISTN